MLFGVAVVVFALGFHVIFADEPKCLSRFDYDEKMLLKLLRIEDKLEQIETFIQDMKSVDLENLKQKDQQLQMEMNVLQENMATTAEHSNKTETLLNDNISITNASMSLLQTQIKSVTSPTIAFLVKNPAYESDKVIFKSELLNEGNAFSPETGEFLAPLPGLYYFSFHLLALSSTKYTACYFYKNRNTLDVFAFADGTTSSNDSGSMSVFVTLNSADIINLGGCWGRPSVSFDRSTTLTGALIKVNNV